MSATAFQQQKSATDVFCINSKGNPKNGLPLPILIPQKRDPHSAKAELIAVEASFRESGTLIAGEDPQSPTPSYTFTAKTTDYASRFRLAFSSGVAGEAACEPTDVLRLIGGNTVRTQKIVIE